jgi:hypothetical protein
LQNEYNMVQKQKLNCTANDVRIAEVTNIRDPHTGATLTSCIGGANFNFLADFKIVTTSSQARENIGLYIATNSTTQALTGTCQDRIISQRHPCLTNSSLNCGSDNYHETDASPDNCGDTSSGDGGGTGVEIVTLEIDNFLCEAPTGSTQLVLPNCTSWQIPGGTIQCVSNSPDIYPFNGPGGTPTAIPGSPSKCNCGVIPLAITVQNPSVAVTKACTTTASPGTNTSCNLTPEGGSVTYTVTIDNQSNFGDIVVDQICDDQYGNIFTVSNYSGASCPAGLVGSKGTYGSSNCSALTVTKGTPQFCTFTATQTENVTVIDKVTIKGHGASAGTFGPTDSNSVTVVSHEAATTGTITKSFVGNTAGCATVRYGVSVANTSAAGTDETLSLTGLTDDSVDITTTGTAILGTTCGVASGQGTLSGTTGAGVLPATINVGSSYSCQFDRQFCGALVNGCFSHTDTVSATLADDESGAVTVTPGSLNLKECLAGTPQ